MLNDLKLAQEAAKSSGVKAPIGAAAAALYRLYVDHGGAETDFSGIIKFLRGSETAGNRAE
jgi:3-hydroxyisobutyrate dehydrogenase